VAAAHGFQKATDGGRTANGACDYLCDGVEFAGPLTPAVLGLFVEMEPSLEELPELWDYRLVQNGEVILSIGDFHDLLIDMPV
jgi:hypothetical protein